MAYPPHHHHIWPPVRVSLDSRPPHNVSPLCEGAPNEILFSPSSSFIFEVCHGAVAQELPWQPVVFPRWPPRGTETFLETRALICIWRSRNIQTWAEFLTEHPGTRGSSKCCWYARVWFTWGRTETTSKSHAAADQRSAVKWVFGTTLWSLVSSWTQASDFLLEVFR